MDGLLNMTVCVQDTAFTEVLFFLLSEYETNLSANEPVYS